MTRSVFNHRRRSGLYVAQVLADGPLLYWRLNDQPTSRASDNFDRPDSVSVLGSTNGAGALDPLPWTARLGTWGILNNLAYAPSAPAIATVDTGLADCILEMTFGATNDQGIVFRYVDNNNYWRATKEGTAVWVSKTVGGVKTNVNGSTGGVTTLKVILSGSNIHVYRDNVLAFPAFSDAQFATATKHGMYSATNTATQASWTISALVAADRSGNGRAGAYVPGAGEFTLSQPSAINSDPADRSIALAHPAGTTDMYIASAASTAFDTASMTLEAWTKPASGQTTKHGVASVVSGANHRWYVRVQPTTGDVEIFNGATTLTGLAAVARDAWSHLIVTFASSTGTWRTYVNGSAQGFTSGSLGATTNGQFVCGHNNGTGAGSEELVGGEDEVALYGTVLDAARVAAHFAAAS